MQGPDAPKTDNEKERPKDYMEPMKTCGQVKARTIGTIGDTERAYVELITLEKGENSTQEDG